VFHVSSFVPSGDAVGSAIDLSRSWTLDGVEHPALPGMTAAQQGAARDLGWYLAEELPGGGDGGHGDGPDGPSGPDGDDDPVDGQPNVAGGCRAAIPRPGGHTAWLFGLALAALAALRRRRRPCSPRPRPALIPLLTVALVAAASTARAGTLYADGEMQGDCVNGDYSVENRDCSRLWRVLRTLRPAPWAAAPPACPRRLDAARG
jgi:MYXO-CTERM domain-containing protein